MTPILATAGNVFPARKVRLGLLAFVIQATSEIDVILMSTNVDLTLVEMVAIASMGIMSGFAGASMVLPELTAGKLCPTIVMIVLV